MTSSLMGVALHLSSKEAPIIEQPSGKERAVQGCSMGRALTNDSLSRLFRNHSEGK